MSKKYSDKRKESWNPEDWQGRKKEQVEFNYLMVGVSLTIFLLSIVTSLLFIL
jgi:hypothetical protein